MPATYWKNQGRLELSQRGPWFSLSLRERAGVRGNGPWKVKTAELCNWLPGLLANDKPGNTLRRHFDW